MEVTEFASRSRGIIVSTVRFISADAKSHNSVLWLEKLISSCGWKMGSLKYIICVGEVVNIWLNRSNI